MKLNCPVSVSAATLFSRFFIFLSLFLLPSATDGSNENQVPYYTTTDVAINCGYLGNSTAHDGRQWFGDEAGAGARSSFSMLLEPRGGESTSLTADYRYLSVDPIPYLTARVSATEFYYTFRVNPGQKFIRLHFYPSSYGQFEKSRDFFTVEAGPFTLLRNFSASVTADALGVKYLVKEYCVNIGEDEYLNLTFSPSPHNTKDRSFYAFVNGIEIVSMPTGLYFTRDGDLGVPIVGQNTSYVVDNSSALQLVQRLNVGGSYISPAEDFGMFRRWTEDAKYLFGSSSKNLLQPRNHFVDGIRYGNLPVFTVPLKIFYTSWRTHSKYGRRGNEIHNFTWKIPVDLGFGYLVRLHFCDLGLQVREGEIGEFNVVMNHLIAEIKGNVMRYSGGIGVPTYRDYVVMVKGDKREDKFDLLITLQSSDELVAGLLHGLEIFKLSSLDNNLASPNPVFPRQDSTTWSLNTEKFVLAFGKIKSIVKSVTILIIVLNVILFNLRKMRRETYYEEKDNLSASTEKSFHKFSFGEMKSATHNFSDEFLIGRGGFGNVYKGYICGGSKIVAVKRLKSNSKQGAQEFWAEIESLSKIKHIHLLPLIGYCNDYGEMILVYEYIARGTLADNIYKFGTKGRESSSNTPLTWEQRLRICIGTARALDYLHTGIEHGIIHRDVKDTNILLDDNLVAKISDFGLSKLEKITESQYYVSTKVRGTFGYLDPDYLISQRLTRKSDIYSFGVVLLVVLCGKPAVDRSIPGETRTLVSSFREGIEKGKAEDIIDPCLRGTISSECFSEFLTCIESCLQYHPKKRSTMAQIVARLERALELQQNVPPPPPSISEGAAVPPGDQESSEVENLQPPSVIDEEESVTVTGTSPLDEGIIGEEDEIHTGELTTLEVSKTGEMVNTYTREVSQSGEKEDTFDKKPLWVWSFLKIGGTNKSKLFSGNEQCFSVKNAYYHEYLHFFYLKTFWETCMCHQLE